jgi:hypothetical protein
MQTQQLRHPNADNKHITTLSNQNEQDCTTHLSTRISQRARADVSRIVPALKNGNNLVEKHRTLLAPAAVDFDLRSVRFMRQNAAASINIHHNHHHHHQHNHHHHQHHHQHHHMQMREQRTAGRSLVLVRRSPLAFEGVSDGQEE